MAASFSPRNSILNFWHSSRSSPLFAKEATKVVPSSCGIRSQRSHSRSENSLAEWRSKGNEPPRTDPYFVPAHVADIARKQATTAIVNAVRLAHFVGKLENRTVPLSGFVGSPANCWSHWFLFPPLPKSLGGHPIPDVYQVSLELLVERFAPVFQV